MIYVSKHAWNVYAAWVLFTEAVGALAGWLTRSGIQLYTQTVTQPPLAPPPIVFPIVWAILYALMGIGGARVFLSVSSLSRTRGLVLYLLQLAVNFCWPLLFFSLRAYGLSLVWLALLWVLIWVMLAAFRRVDPLAAWLQLPYLLWVSFALYLNWGVWQLNSYSRQFPHAAKQSSRRGACRGGSSVDKKGREGSGAGIIKKGQ